MKDNVIPTGDMSGIVVSIGPHVKNISVGDGVVAPVNPDFIYGNFAFAEGALGGPSDGVLREYITLPAVSVVKLPVGWEKTSFASWAAVTGTGVTAWNVFYGGRSLRPGDVVLLEG